MSQDGALDELFTVLSQTRQINCVLISAVTFLAFDICITFDDEVQYVWKERWSLPKGLYLFGRYFGLINLLISLSVATYEGPSVETCRIYYGIYEAGPILLITSLNILFILRIHALYNRGLKMLAGLIFLFFVELVSGLVLTINEAAVAVHNVTKPPQGVHWPGCATTPAIFSQLVVWVPAIFVASMFFILTLVKFVIVFQSSHSGWSIGKLREINSYSPIMVAFVRDGTVFFLLIFSVVLINTIASQALSGPFQGLFLPWLTAIYSFSASRLVLNIRGAGVLDNPTTDTESFSLDLHWRVMHNSVDTDGEEV
ncbi:hypothetical protein C8R47DRAFT_1101497 [Mycena vitilis]|nr:hypothetical protein C8R47DRAFT_1101497 [Mycena vitilis]